MTRKSTYQLTTMRKPKKQCLLTVFLLWHVYLSHHQLLPMLPRMMGSMVLRMPWPMPPSVHHHPPSQDFSFHFPHIFIHTVSLADGHKVVFGDYLVPTLHLSRFKVNVVHDGEVAVLYMNIPKTFADMNACALIEVNANNNPDSR